MNKFQQWLNQFNKEQLVRNILYFCAGCVLLYLIVLLLPTLMMIGIMTVLMCILMFIFPYRSWICAGLGLLFLLNMSVTDWLLFFHHAGNLGYWMFGDYKKVNEDYVYAGSFVFSSFLSAWILSKIPFKPLNK